MSRSNSRLILPVLLSLALLPAMGGPSRAEDFDQASTDQTGSIDTRRQVGLAEYERVAREMTLSGEKLAKLAADIATVKKDSVALTAAAIQSAKTEKKLSQDIDEIEQRLATLKQQEAGARASLISRRDVLANVLAALERMGLNPPPALLVRPEDALSSVRSAILLGAVVPELRGQTDAMLADLTKLTRLTASIGAERDGLKEAVAAQLVEKRKLDILLDEKKKLRRDSETQLADERNRAVELAAQAKSLKELVDTLEAEAAKSRAQTPAVTAAIQPPPDSPALQIPMQSAVPAIQTPAVDSAAVEPPAPASQTQEAALQLPDANLLLGPQPFESLAKQLELPVSGRFTKRFGRPDGNGAVMQGDTVATQSDAIVTAPADGDVLYAGPFRSYGELLILNVGNGYHVVLAGMNRINVAPGQAVLAGEPVGAMGDTRVASAAAGAVGTAGQELYIEFRKDGKPVDPAAWWAKRPSGRNGNDT